MKVKKFLKGLMAAALAVTMAVTPASAVKAAEVTVTNGAYAYTFSETPVAAFEVTGFSEMLFDDNIDGTGLQNRNKAILYCLPEGTQISAQDYLGFVNAHYIGYLYGNQEDKILLMNRPNSSEPISVGGAFRNQGKYIYGDFYELLQIDAPRDSKEFSYPNISGDYAILVVCYKEGDDLSVIPDFFARVGGSAVQIPVSDALAMDNANVQLDTANTQTADAQAQADALAAQQAAAAQAQADAQAAQQAAEAAQAQAQADALVAQQAADAAAQAQITAQPDSTVVSQGTYTVEANDNLCKIAEKVYGDRKAWKEIYKANPTIKSDYVIYRGQVLVIPAR